MSVTKIPVAGLALSDSFSGVLETNATFVDQAIFGPSVDGKSWNGKWGVESLYSSLMLVTIEDAGADTQVNIWDLTEQSAGAPSTTPLGTVTLSGDATPTSVAACMGYIIVGSEDGTSIIDPHSGSWAERTAGYPKSLSTSTLPVLADNDVVYVCAGLSDQPPLDPRTGGPMPCFGVSYGTGSRCGSLIKYDGNVWDNNGTGEGCVISGGKILISRSDINAVISSGPIDATIADGWAGTVLIINDFPYTFDAENAMSMQGDFLANASASGLGLAKFNGLSGTGATTPSAATVTIDRTYNTGYMVGDIRGAWLANSATTDRSYKANTLTENGTVTEAAVASGAELMGYSGFSDSNNLTRASDADWDVIGTGSAYMSIWFKSTGESGTSRLFGFANSGNTVRFGILLQADGQLNCLDDGATASVETFLTGVNDDSVWHKADFVRVSSTERYAYLDGVLKNSNTTDSGSVSDSGNLPFGIGIDPSGSGSSAAASTLALARLSATAPSATQIRQMYDAEKGMFVASAECLLQSGSTDAVLDVDVDPLTGKVLVTQTDAITIFDGLVVDSKPTVNSGSSEKGKLWGDLRAEQNSANAYVTAPAVDQRQVNEMVRGLASDLPAGPDLSKAKAWIRFSMASSGTINGSYNVKSITDGGAGLWTINFGVPFKSANYAVVGMAPDDAIMGADAANVLAGSTTVKVRDNASSAYDATGNYVVFFGELENE